MRSAEYIVALNHALLVIRGYRPELTTIKNILEEFKGRVEGT